MVPQPPKDIPRPPASPIARPEPVPAIRSLSAQTWREAASPLCKAILIGDPFIWEPGLRAGLAWPLPTPPSINLVTQTAVKQRARPGS